MKSRFHIIFASDDGCSRSLVFSRDRLSLLLVMTGLLTAVALAATLFSLYTLVMLPGHQEQVGQLSARIKSLQSENRHLVAQVDHYQREKKQLMSGAVDSLTRRTAQLESILTQVGVTISDTDEHISPSDAESKQGASANSGGPFVAVDGEVAGQVDSADGTADVLNHSDKLLDIIAQVPLGRPCIGYCSSAFGRRTDPINGRKAFHSGIDIASNVGTKVYATADGTVANCGSMNGYGKMIKLCNGSRFSTVFGHLQKILVAKGTHVSRGDLIGLMGSTGRSTGPHLHYEIRDRGRAVNPYGFTFL